MGRPHWALAKLREPRPVTTSSSAIAWSLISTGEDYFDLALIERKKPGEFPQYSLQVGAVRNNKLQRRPWHTFPDGTERSDAIAEYAVAIFNTVHERARDSATYQLRHNHVIADNDVALDRVEALQAIHGIADTVKELERRLSGSRASLNAFIEEGLALGVGVTWIARAAGMSRQAIYDVKNRAK